MTVDTDANLIMRTKTDVEQYRSVAQQFVQDWHNNITRWRAYYNFQHYRTEPLPYEERYNDPTPTNVVDLAVGIIQAKDIEWTAQGWEPDIEEQEDSSTIEKFLSGLLYINSERNEYHVPYEATFHFVRDGAAVIYSVWDKNLADEVSTVIEDENVGMSVKVFDEPPVVTEVIDPTQIWLVPGGPYRWSHIIREWKMSVWDVEQTWGVTLKYYAGTRPLQKMQTMVKVQDYWHIYRRKVQGTFEKVVEHALVAANEVITPIQEMEGYEDIPYTIGFFKPTNRDKSSGWHGIIRPLESTITLLEKGINRRQRQIFVYSALPLVARAIPSRKFRFDPALGELVHLDINESLEFPTWPGNAPDVDAQIGFYRSRLQQTGFSDIMFGAGPSQVSGYALSQLSDQSRIRLVQPIKHLELLWSMWAKKVLRLVKNFASENSRMRVYGQLRGQNFAAQIISGQLHKYMVKADIEPEFPNDQVRNHAMAIQVKDQLSPTTIMEKYLDVDQPDEENKKRLRDMAMRHPMVQQFAIMNYLLQAAESDDQIISQAAAMTLQQIQQGMIAANQAPGRPAQGPQPGNALGTQSATGEAPRQAGGGEPMGQSIEDMLNQAINIAPNLTGGFE